MTVQKLMEALKVVIAASKTADGTSAIEVLVELANSERVDITGVSVWRTCGKGDKVTINTGR